MEERRPPSAADGYEAKDVSGRGLRLFAVGLVVVCAAILLGLAGLFRVFQAREDALQPPRDAIGANARGTPPQPRLEETPARDLKRFRESEDQILGSYSWVDKERGIIRMPIGRAMELTIERSLPARGAQPPGEAPVPTESSTLPPPPNSDSRK